MAKRPPIAWSAVSHPQDSETSLSATCNGWTYERVKLAIASAAKTEGSPLRTIMLHGTYTVEVIFVRPRGKDARRAVIRALHRERVATSPISLVWLLIWRRHTPTTSQADQGLNPGA